MSPETTPTVVPFNFLNLFITKAIYELLPSPVAVGVRQERVEVDIMVGASAQIARDGSMALVKLDTKVMPKLDVQPYRVEVGIAAVFKSQGGTENDLRTFCQHAAPSILFPYIRETVHRLTMDAPNGVIRLDPMNISQMLNQTEWEISQGPPQGLSLSSEPPPPSSLSPSDEQGSKRQP